MRLLMLSHNAALAFARFFGRPRPRPGGTTCDILLTGRFDSDGWVTSHLTPMAASEGCSRLCVVSTSPVPPIPNVEIVRPPPWLVSILGATLARHLVFAWTAARRRPDIVGGFHLLPNGLVSSVLARLVGARSLYICTGGPVEVIDGGIWGEPGPFARMETPDPVVERCLLRAVLACDLVITRGTRTVEFFRSRGLEGKCCVVAGGIDSGEFRPLDAPPSTDLIFVGRLAEIKRIDVFLEAVKRVRGEVPTLTATIVGDGPLRGELERLAADLGVGDCVRFAGHQKSVGDRLRRARIFVLTSRSEGLSLALIEAMMCGLPAVVSDVGDLADLVEDGVNGYLVKDPSPNAFAARIVDLLTDDRKYAALSRAACRSALRYERSAVKRKWDEILLEEAAAGMA